MIRRELAAASPDPPPGPRNSLDDLGVLFSELGRSAQALPVTEEALAMWRELAAASPDRYRTDLATSLSNLVVRFSELRRLAEALPVTEQAVAMWRELAAASPDRYRTDLATSLSNPGLLLSKLDRLTEAPLLAARPRQPVRNRTDDIHQAVPNTCLEPSPPRSHCRSEGFQCGS